jgi:hypothetical protein
MMLRYNVVPATMSAQRHARLGPMVSSFRGVDEMYAEYLVQVFRMISSTATLDASSSPIRTPAPLNRQAASTSAAGGNMPVFESPVPARTLVRLSTLPPDFLGEELERGDDEVQILARKPNSSPARSHITVHSDDETPEREMRPPRGRGRRAARGRGGPRSRGGSSRGRGGSIGRTLAPQASASTSVSSKGPERAARLQMVVELPSPSSRKKQRT